jgi:Kinetochore complex Fta4 of Sim4 subunit, or CENP-50
MTTDDIYSRKKAFLEGQVRRLTTTLAPSREYKAAAASTTVEDNDRLSETMVDNAIYKRIILENWIVIAVNLALRKQYRLQYSTQAIRHVATQLDELYRSNINADREIGIRGGESATFLDILSGHADLTDSKYETL